MKRISIVVWIFCMCLVCLTWSQQQTGKVCTGWREFHRPDMMRWNPCEKVLNINNVGSLSLKWSYETDGAMLRSSPAVTNGVVYIGSYDGNVYALNARTGALLWKYNTGYEVWSSPAIANGVVYVGAEPNVFALDARTGSLLWTFSTGGDFFSSPAVAKGVVYIGNWDGNLYALDANTGTLLWSYPAGGFSSPAVANGVVYVGWWDHNVYALDASTGTLLWSYCSAPLKTGHVGPG